MTTDEMKRYKELTGATTEQIAALSGVPVGTLQKIFSGETKNPRYRTRQALEKALRQLAGESLNGSEGSAPGSKAPSGSNAGNEAVRSAGGAAYRFSESAREVREELSAYGSLAGAGMRPGRYDRHGSYTVSDYYALPEDQRVELIDGVFYDMDTPSFIHQRFVFYLAHVVQNYIHAHGGGCIPMVSPVDVRLDRDDKTMLQPDALILCDKGKIRRWGIDGAPDFILEVLSSSTRRKDLTIKLRKYMNAGVREYWILDPDKQKLYTYDFGEEGIPGIYPLRGEVPVAIYGGDLRISLDELAAFFDDLPEEDPEIS